MKCKKLTNTAVEAFSGEGYASGKHEGEIKPHSVLWCGSTVGFGVRYSAKSQTRTYIFQFRVRGLKNGERTITIGRHGDPYRVDDARTLAQKLKVDMLAGIDPAAEEQRKKEESERQSELKEARAATLRDIMEHYLLHKRTKHGPLRDATKHDIRRHCEKNLTAWLDDPVANITRNMCMERFIELSARAPTQANGCMIYLRALLNYARELYATDDGEAQILAQNPVTRLFKLRKPNPVKPRTTRIPLNRIGACWSWLRKRSAEARTENEKCSADWLSTVMLTGARRKESGSLKRTQIDLVARTIRFTSDVAKNHNEIVLPMSDALHEILSARINAPPPDEGKARRRRVQRSTEYVFATNGKKCPYIRNAQKTLKHLSAVAGTHVHLHAIRRTFDDVSDACGIHPDRRRLLLNHVSGDVHAIHYANNPDDLKAIASIANWLVGQARIFDAQASGANVVPFPSQVAG